MEAAHRGHFKGSKNSNIHSIGLKIEMGHKSTKKYHIDLEKEFKYFRRIF